MNKITIEQAEAIVGKALAEGWMEAANIMIEKSDSQYITAEEARKLGSGNAEWFDDYRKSWEVCDADSFDPSYQYRAIKQEPVEPHAELKAMYQQQVKDGTLDNFVWEYESNAKYGDFSKCSLIGQPPKFDPLTKYRCTPKPTCQIKNLDTGELKTMTREAAKKLQDETKDVCDWFDPAGVPHHEWCFGFNGIYTYKLKGTVIKLTIDGETKMVTEAECNAERSARADTHIFIFTFGVGCQLVRKKPEPKPWTCSREDVIALLNDMGVTK